MDNHEKIKQKRVERIAEFIEMGIPAFTGECQGYIQFAAGSAEEILRRLRRLNKSEGKTNG